MNNETLAKILWKIARALYRADDFMRRCGPGRYATRIIDWMEHRGICCERHRKPAQPGESITR